MPKRSGANLIVQVCVCNNTLLIRVENCPRQIWLEGREQKLCRNNIKPKHYGTPAMIILFYPADARAQLITENNKSEDCLKSIWSCFQIAETSQRARGIATEAVRCESQTSVCWKQEWLVWAKTYRSRGFSFVFFLFWRPFCPLVLLNKMATWRMRFSFLLFHY